MSVRLCQRVSRPVVNLFVSRDRRDGFTQEDGTKVLYIYYVTTLFLRNFVQSEISAKRTSPKALKRDQRKN